jgi:hypothetical protein
LALHGTCCEPAASQVRSIDLRRPTEEQMRRFAPDRLAAHRGHWSISSAGVVAPQTSQLSLVLIRTLHTGQCRAHSDPAKHLRLLVVGLGAPSGW